MIPRVGLVLVLLATAACGRVGFDPQGGDSALPSDTGLDGAVDAMDGAADALPDVALDVAPDVVLADCEMDSDCPACQFCDTGTNTCAPVVDGAECGVAGTCRFGLCCAGCWAGASCVSGALASQCGSGGELCTPCADTEACFAGTCVPRSAATTLALGNDHACLVRVGGGAHCWGDNARGELGLGAGDTTPRTIPTMILDEGLERMAVGDGFSCGINEMGDLYCWGTGLGAAGGAPGVPTLIGTDYSTISASDGHACAITVVGELFCWGDDTRGQLGLGPGDDSTSTPTRVGTDTDWTHISTGPETTCGIRLGEFAWCWGDGARGALANACATGADAPIAVTLPRSVSSVSVGDGRVWAIERLAGAVLGWGDDTNDALGVLGTSTTHCDPVALDGVGTVVSIAGGLAHGCSVNTAGALLCWGQGESGVLGLDDLIDRPSPTRLGGGWTGVGAAGLHTCALSPVNEVFCWGLPYGGGAPVLRPALITF